MPGPNILDVFRSDAFTTMALTAGIEKRPYLPVGLGALKIFDPDPIRTTAVAIEERAGVLTLIPVSERGAPGAQRTGERRKARYFDVPRLRKSDVIRASELQNVREFVDETGAAVTVEMQLQTEIARRLSGPTGLQADMEYTREFHRLGAAAGILYDADGSSVIYNWFEEFNISAPAEIDFDLAAGATAETGTLRPTCNDVVRGMARAAGGAFTAQTSVIGLCGDDFWDGITNHQDARKTFLATQEAAEQRRGLDPTGLDALGFGSFTYGGITWVNYRGSDDGTTVGVASTKVKFIPVNAPGIFREVQAPGESFEWVNQPGKKEYVRIMPDLVRNEYVELEVDAYPLHICTRPGVLYSGRA